MLKSRITKAEYDALSDALKAVYKADGDNYLLQSDDAAELRAAKDRASEELRLAKEETKRLKDEKAEADRQTQEAKDEAEREKARKAGDVTALETSWQAKLDAAVGTEKARADKFEALLKGLLVDSTAAQLAAEISTAPNLLTPVIAKRLQADLTGDKPLTRVLDGNGAPSALNIDDLKKELVANKEYAAIIRASNASGGGANGNNSGGGAAGKKIKDMTEAEKVAFHRANPALYKEQARQEGLPVYG